MNGSCLCKRISYSISEKPEIMNICHCNICRKFSGSSYGIYIHALAETFNWTSGEELISKFESSPTEFRAFCKICGSSLPSTDSNSEYVCIPAGSLNDDPGLIPAVQIFTGSKAPWHKLDENIVAFKEFEPDVFWD